MIKPKYITYPATTRILTEDEIELLLVLFINANQGTFSIVKCILEEIKDYLSLKEGNEYAMVLKGSQISEAILSENSELRPEECDEPEQRSDSEESEQTWYPEAEY